MKTKENLLASIKESLNSLEFTIENLREESLDRLFIVSCKLYVIDCLHIDFSNVLINNTIYFTCKLGKLKKEWQPVFQKENSRCDIVENLFFLNMDIDDKLFFALDKKEQYEELTLNSHIILKDILEAKKEVIHAILTLFCNTIREYIEFIHYITVSDDHNYIYIKKYKN